MIWLELDRDLTANAVIPAGKVREIAAANRREQVIPGIEPDIRVQCRALRSEEISYFIRARGSSAVPPPMPTHLPGRRSWETGIGSATR